MNIEVGEYIRTKNGVIAQLEYIHDKDEVYWFDKVIYCRYGEEIDFLTTEELPKYIVNHSKNIIDLIEVGDFVNGNKVHSVDFSTSIQTGEKYLVIDKIYQSVKYFYEKDIKTIVTKLQFSNMEYRV